MQILYGSTIFRRLIFPAFICFCLTLSSPVHGTTRIVIAKSGAGKTLIDNTLPAATLAAAMDVDHLELPTVMTADDELIVFQDLTLNRVTDVHSLFPERTREDGGYYVIDFTLAEIRQLRLKNIFETDPLSLSLSIPTLREELSLIRRLETILNKEVGIVLEIKQPWFHIDEGKDISSTALDTLARFNYTSMESKIYLQCFDPEELQRIHNRLFPEKKMRLPLIQLIGQNNGQEAKQQHLGKWEPYNYDWMFTNIGLRMIAGYAAAIALPSASIADENGTLLLKEYIEDVHKYGLKVLTFSLNNQEEEFPPFVADFSSLLTFYYSQAGIDGLYTDSFQDVLQYDKQRAVEKKSKSDLPAFFSDLELSRPTLDENDLPVQLNKK